MPVHSFLAFRLLVFACFIRSISRVISCFSAFHSSCLPSLSPPLPVSFRISAPYTLFILESVFLGPRCYRRMFVRLLVPPLIFASFIRSISRVISSFSTFRVSNASPDSTGAMGRVPLPPPSREDSTTRAFTLVNVYGGPIASRNCRSLSLRAKCCTGGGAEEAWRAAAGVRALSKAFYVLLPTDAARVTPPRNIFALMK